MKKKLLLTSIYAGLFHLSLLASPVQAETQAINLTNDISPDGIGTVFGFDAPVINQSGSVAYMAVLIDDAINTPRNSRGILHYQSGILNLLARTGYASPIGGTFTILGIHTLGNDEGILYGASTSGGDGGTFLQNAAGNRRLLHLGQLPTSGPGTLTSATEFSTLPGSTSFVTNIDFTDVFNTSTNNTGIYLQSSSNFQKLVHKGQAAPPGTSIYDSFLTMGSPAANTRGQTAFNATLLGRKFSQPNQDGIYLTDPQNILLQIARQGQVAFDTKSFSATRGAPEVNNGGKVAFVSGLKGSGGFTDSYGVFIGDGLNPFITVMKSSDTTPDGNGVFDGRISGVLANGITDSGQVAFASNLMNTAGGFNDDTGLFTGNGSSIKQIVREGQSTPDGNGQFDDLYSSNRGLNIPTVDNATVNQAGVVAFLGNLKSTAGGFADNQGIYLSDGHEIIKVIRRGDTLNGSTVSFLNVDFAGPHPIFSTVLDKIGNPGMGFNDNGQVAYRAALTNATEGVFLFTPELHLHTLSGSAPTAWEAGNAWTLGLGPAAPHRVFIDTGAGKSVTGPVADTTIKALTIGTNTGASDALHLNGGGELTVTQGVNILQMGELFGTNTLHADVINGGLIAPGNSPGLLTIDGDYTQESTGTLLMELAGLNLGSGYDSLNITGTANLAGILDIQLLDGFTLTAGDSFDLLTAALIQGNFDSINLPTLNGLHLNLLQDATHLSLQVTSAVPIPAAVWLFGSGLIALLGVAKRKHFF